MDWSQIFSVSTLMNTVNTATIVMTVVNVGLNILFVFRGMGIRGIGYSTSISYYAALLILCAGTLLIPGGGDRIVSERKILQEKTARMAEETGTYLVPTFTPFHDAVMGDEDSMQMKSPEFCRKLHKYQKRLQEGRTVTLASSIKLGYGTDIVTNYNSFDHGVEYRCWLESGADPFRALQAATKNNAEIC